MDFAHNDILTILPHRPPFLFIDKVQNVIPGQEGTGIKRLSADELLLAASQMQLPNILHLEIMAQTTAIICAALAVNGQAESSELSAQAGMGYLAGGDLHFIDSSPAVAGDTLLAQVKIVKNWGQFILATGTIEVDGRHLSNGSFTIALAG